MFTQEEKDKYMNLAIEQARIAEKQDEVPIGAIVIDPEGNVVGRGYNRRELDQDATKHAEIIAIREACEQIGYWRLVDCSIFITLEPCPMCAGAIINSRIKNVFFGAYDPKAGASGSVIDLFAVEKFNHHPEVEGGVKENETSQMLTQFFRAIRAKKKAEKLAKKNKSEE